MAAHNDVNAVPCLHRLKCHFSITLCEPNWLPRSSAKLPRSSPSWRKSEPVLITQHGRPAAYLLDIETYAALNQRIAILEGIARGERAVEEGRVVPHAEAKKRMARWLS